MRNDGSVVAWGSNSQGQLGNNSTSDSNTPVQVIGFPGTPVGGASTGATAIAAGGYHSLALHGTGIVWAWGANWDGQLGNGTTTSSSIPQPVPNLTGITAIAAGDNQSYALKSDGSVWAWGENEDGDLGDGSDVEQNSPVEVSGLTSGVRAIAAGYYHGLALKWDGTVWAWGDNGYGELGNGSGQYEAYTPVKTAVNNAVAIAAGEDFSLALLADGTVVAWGYGGEGQLGDNGAQYERPTPQTVQGVGGVVAIAAGYEQALALKNDGTYYAWGGNYEGELGTGSSGGTSTPVQGQLTGLAGLAAGEEYSVGFTGPTPSAPAPPGAPPFSCSGQKVHSGAVYGWGVNSYGEVGDGTTNTDPVPVQVSDLLDSVTAVATGYQHSVAVKTDGSVWAWGDNSYGELGDNEAEATSPVPIRVQMPGSPCITQISASSYGYFTLALDSSGNVYAWGDNNDGDLGNNSYESEAVPVPVQGLPKPAIAIAAGYQFSLALLVDGSVWAWGDNRYGELGDNANESDADTALPVPSLSSGVVAVAAGGFFGMALKADGSLYAWGDNYDHEIGDGTQTERNSPVQVFDSGSGASSIAAGAFHALVVKSDGSVLGWGYNYDGELCIPGGGEISTPTAATGLEQPVVSAAGGEEMSLFRTRLGTIVACGSEYPGMLGDGGTEGSDSAAVQVQGMYGNDEPMASGGGQSLSVVPPGPPEPKPSVVPSAPGTPTVVPGNGFATLTWAPPEYGNPVASYTITASPDNGGPPVTSGVYGRPAGQLVSGTIQGLTSDCSTQYSFTVTASNVLGTGTPSGSTPKVLPSGIPGAQPSVAVILIQGIGSSIPTADPVPHGYQGTYDPVDSGSASSTIPTYCNLRATLKSNKPPLPESLASLVDYFDSGTNGYGVPTPDLTDALAATGALILPFSYNGVSVSGGPGDQPKINVGEYGQGAPGSDLPDGAAQTLRAEVDDVHTMWPSTPIVIIGHSEGGLVAQTYFDSVLPSENPQPPVSYAFTLDSPINGAAEAPVADAFALTPLYGKALGAFHLSSAMVNHYYQLWHQAQAGMDQSLLQSDPQYSTTDYALQLFGTDGDIVYDIPDYYLQKINAALTCPVAAAVCAANAGYKGLDSQLLYPSFPTGDYYGTLSEPDWVTPGSTPNIVDAYNNGDLFISHERVYKDPSNIAYLAAEVQRAESEQPIFGALEPAPNNVSNATAASRTSRPHPSLPRPSALRLTKTQQSLITSRQQGAGLSNVPRQSSAPEIGPTSSSNTVANAAAPGQSITIAGSGFGTTQGQVVFNGTGAPVPGTPTSWADGAVTVTIPSGAITGPVFIIAASGGSQLVGGVTVLGPATSVATLTETDMSGTVFDGESATVQIAARDATGLPVANASVALSDGLAVEQTAQTNTAGIASLSVPVYGANDWTAFSGGSSTTFELKSQSPPSMSLSVTAAQATAAVGDAVAVSAKLTSSPGGAPAGGQTVTFSVSGPNGVSLSTTTATTDATGTATTTLSSTQSGNAVVEAMSDFNTVSGAASVGFAPQVTGLSVSSGYGNGGTSVTITGAAFADGSAVHFGTAAASNVTVVNDSTITALSPAGAGTVDVTVISGGVSSAPAAIDRFSYVASPAVDAVTPNQGPTGGGTTILISGSNFSADSAVSFGGTPAASITVNSASSIAATSPAGSAGRVDIVVSTGQGGPSAMSQADAFTYESAPSVSSLSPEGGPLSGGTTITINGAGFVWRATSVTVGGEPATSVVVFDGGSSLTAVTPSQASAAVADVIVSTPGGTSTVTPADEFMYEVAPSLSSISPAGGPVVGGTQVTVTGTGFASDASVSFGGAPATNVIVDSPTSITATSPSVNGPASVDVVVTTFGGATPITGADSFSYGAPAIDSVSPNAGPLAGGTLVYIFGHGFTPDATVSFGGVPASSVTIESATSIAATSPADSAGAVDIVVSAFQGVSATTSADQFAYESPPTLTSVAPNSGSKYGGTSVTISGANFTSGTSVSFGGLYAQVTVESSTTLLATSPDYYDAYYWYYYSYPRTVGISVTTPGGSTAASSSDQFTFENPPAVWSVSPDAGAAGTSVTLTGYGFTTGASVRFGGTAATNVVVSSSSSLTASAPAGSGTQSVTVTDANGVSPNQNSVIFAYAAPTVTSVGGASGPTAGGNWVDIDGNNFVPDSSVSFGGVQSTDVRFVGSGY
ncbi:MAG: IPT/TIG domain-containing protein, partial [Candidatus Dormibacteraeota bacterium]|nr:IPT/TIG domain-containing protein [Candidatus Dormibacteraeota bacterium]